MAEAQTDASATVRQKYVANPLSREIPLLCATARQKRNCRCTKNHLAKSLLVPPCSTVLTGYCCSTTHRYCTCVRRSVNSQPVFESLGTVFDEYLRRTDATTSRRYLASLPRASDVYLNRRITTSDLNSEEGEEVVQIILLTGTLYRGASPRHRRAELVRRI